MLGLEDPVANYIPSFKNLKVADPELEEGIVDAKKSVTVLHLMTHTSGMGYGPMLGGEADGDAEGRFVPVIERANLGRTNPSDPQAIKSLAEWCDAIAEVPLVAQPGTRWIYSYSHDVLGRVIEVVSGEPLEAFLQRRVFEPLGMVDSGFTVPFDKWHRTAGMYRYVEPEEPEQSAESQGPAVSGMVAPSETADSAKGGLRRLDDVDPTKNAWVTGNSGPILSGGGSVDGMTGGLVSTIRDYAQLCLMLLGKGTLDGLHFLKPETVALLSSNHLPRVAGSDVWAFDNPGVGFSPLGSVGVAHPDLDAASRPGEYGWGGMAGTAWTNDPKEDFSLLSFSLTAFDLTTEEVLRAGVRDAIKSFDKASRRHRPSSRGMTKRCIAAALSMKSGLTRKTCAKFLDILAGRAKREVHGRGEFKIPGVCIIKKTQIAKGVRKATKPVCIIKQASRTKAVRKGNQPLLGKGLRVAAAPGKIVVQALPALTVSRQSLRRRAVGARTALSKSQRVPLRQRR